LQAYSQDPACNRETLSGHLNGLECLRRNAFHLALNRTFLGSGAYTATKVTQYPIKTESCNRIKFLGRFEHSAVSIKAATVRNKGPHSFNSSENQCFKINSLVTDRLETDKHQGWSQQAAQNQL
jgi:hypothetical protein